MKDSVKFETVDPWRIALGLLPVPMRDSAESLNQYVLMNGTSGNFCLDFSGSGDSSAYRTAAWSCDVGHYVTYGSEVVVYRWARGLPEERYSQQSVIGKIHEFHRHLERSGPDRHGSRNGRT